MEGSPGAHRSAPGALEHLMVPVEVPLEKVFPRELARIGKVVDLLPHHELVVGHRDLASRRSLGQ